MGSYLDDLLKSTHELRPFQRTELYDWLRALRADCETFGETPEDTARMNAIKRRLKSEGDPK